ncbi:MAG TPA: gluconokinase [Planctomycetota bacterium]|nr:gluconokinase [Planctomycetota bacterium]
MTPPAPEAPFVLTLDVGTSSARALLFDGAGRAVPDFETRRSYRPRATADGGGDFDPAELTAAVEDLLDEAAVRAERFSPAAVACCTFWHSLMGVDAAGEPVTPLYTWADLRSAAEARSLRASLDEAAYHERTGCFLHPCYHPAKLRWIARTQPDVFARAARWVSFGEFLYARWFGRFRATVSMASATGLLDVRSCLYDEEILRAAGVRQEQLSPLGDVGDAFRGLRPEGARRWPALRDLPWFPPVGDGACNNLGAGAVTPERAGVMVGTSGALRVVVPAERLGALPGLFAYRVDRRRGVVGGALNDGGNLIEWARRTFRLPEEAEREVAGMEPDAHGLTFLPLLAGERSPGWAADARGAIVGLRMATRPVEILRAAMEAVACRFRLILRRLEGVREAVASGGALLRSSAWMQILADALGVPVAASEEPEASCRGAALLALEALGKVGRLEDLPARTGRRFEPDPARHARYARATERQERYYARLISENPQGAPAGGTPFTHVG